MDADDFVLFDVVYNHSPEADGSDVTWEERHIYCKGGHGLAFDFPREKEGRPFRWKVEQGKVVYRMRDDAGELEASVWLVDRDEVQAAYTQCIARMVLDSLGLGGPGGGCSDA